MVVKVYGTSYRLKQGACNRSGLCWQPPCICAEVKDTRHKIIPSGSNRGIIGQLLDSPAYRNSPSAEEYGQVIDDYLNSRPNADAAKVAYQRMMNRIPRVV